MSIWYIISSYIQKVVKDITGYPCNGFCFIKNSSEVFPVVYSGSEMKSAIEGSLEKQVYGIFGEHKETLSNTSSCHNSVQL